MSVQKTSVTFTSAKANTVTSSRSSTFPMMDALSSLLVGMAWSDASKSVMQMLRKRTGNSTLFLTSDQSFWKDMTAMSWLWLSVLQRNTSSALEETIKLFTGTFTENSSTNLTRSTTTGSLQLNSSLKKEKRIFNSSQRLGMELLSDSTCTTQKRKSPSRITSDAWTAQQFHLIAPSLLWDQKTEKCPFGMSRTTKKSQRATTWIWDLLSKILNSTIPFMFS